MEYFLSPQLHASLQRKQEEISALKEKNAQLKELAMQAEHYATILDPYSNGANHGPYSKGSNQELLSSHPDSCAGGSSANRFVGGNQDLNRLRLNQDLQLHSKQPSGQAQQSLALEINLGPKRFKLDQDLLHLDSKDISSQTEQVNLKTTEESPSNKTNHTSMIQVYGAFHGLKVVMARPSMSTNISECGEEEHVCFKTSIREHSTIKTNVFPHGKTFTSRTPEGNCRFLWVPNQN
ncbi:hypothetical protein NFI96_010692 [Prochilodus magdalenae]|nr:hypothetical protein NFI96_010692 [Prochilodus magdalenae]